MDQKNGGEMGGDIGIVGLLLSGQLALKNGGLMEFNFFKSSNKK
jgi:hypothetical protein